MELSALRQRVFSDAIDDFDALALEVFRFQSTNNTIYRSYLDLLQTDRAKIGHVSQIPHLPIEFFKYFEVKSTEYLSQQVFESSSTTGTGVSRHHIDNLVWYESAFRTSFNRCFGDHTSYCHLALLPAYLERQNSSLVYQVDHFIRHSVYPQSSFFLHDFDELKQQLLQNEQNQIPTILWGVTFALLDFIELHPLSLKNTIVIETGGMKGRRKEITREELHSLIKNGFDVTEVAGEYGMTELMSQAYSVRDGIYQCPPQMKVQVREINDPLSNGLVNRLGAINIIDLANVHSCAFIATSDLGKLYNDGSFEILGRLDYSDTRGCNLLVA